MNYNCKCVKCGNLFESAHLHARVCLSCKKRYARDWYKNNTTSKKCCRCQAEFVGTAKQKFCPCCRKKREPYKFKHIHTVVYLCEHCNAFIKQVERNNTVSKGDHYNYDLTCNDCKLKTRQRTSMRMTFQNPSFKGKSYEEAIRYRKPKHVSEQVKLEHRQAASLRMRLNNPMKNAASVQKMLETLNSHKFHPKSGPNSPFWKGNRTISRQIKIILLPWKRKLLHDANFRCSKCGKTKCTLNVHHLRPYREIQAEIFKRHGITDPSRLPLDDSQIILALNEIKEYHDAHPEIGVVVCEECHAKIDPYFKPRKHHKENI